MSRSYSELLRFQTFEDRFRYLALQGVVGGDTFGFDRYLNQQFYASREWRSLRQYVIARDEGCDLAVPGYEVHTKLYIHHMNPMTPEDIKHGNEEILDPEYLITTCLQTHNAIHYGDERQIAKKYSPRRPGDTRLW